MSFVGLDLAWGERNPTGVAVVDDTGRLVHLGVAGGDDDVLATVAPWVGGDTVVAVDAPVVVVNATGKRPAEAALDRDFRRFHAGAHPANTGKPELVGPRAARLAAALNLDIDPHARDGARMIEVYPHAATVALFRLGRTLKYKDKRGRDVAGMRAALLRLIALVEGLRTASVPLDVTSHDGWRALRRDVEAATRKSELRRAEDPVDAVVCAYVALYRHHRPDDVIVYGDAATGAIVTPTLPPDLLPDAAPGTSTVLGDAVERYAARRPALLDTTEHYRALVTALIDDAGIDYLSITARTKTVDSFAAKARRTVDGKALFADPLVEVTDLVGLRVVTYLQEDVDAVATLLTDELRVLDDRDMGRETAQAGLWGYASRHLLIGGRGEQQPASVQIRTVLQHAWAEFEHDIRYKGAVPHALAPDLDRRFTLAAGLLEVADREFSAIRGLLRNRPTETLEAPSPGLGIPTPVLATYLGDRYADAGWSRTDHYGWMSDLLRALGVPTTAALTALLDEVDDAAVNRAMDYRFPAGAVRRLDDALLAHDGERYVALAGNAHRVDLLSARLAKLRDAGVSPPASPGR